MADNLFQQGLDSLGPVDNFGTRASMLADSLTQKTADQSARNWNKKNAQFKTFDVGTCPKCNHNASHDNITKEHDDDGEKHHLDGSVELNGTFKGGGDETIFSGGGSAGGTGEYTLKYFDGQRCTKVGPGHWVCKSFSNAQMRVSSSGKVIFKLNGEVQKKDVVKAGLDGAGSKKFGSDVEDLNRKPVPGMP